MHSQRDAHRLQESLAKRVSNTGEKKEAACPYTNLPPCEENDELDERKLPEALVGLQLFPGAYASSRAGIKPP